MSETFNPTQFWLEHFEHGRRKAITAQENLIRLHPELFKDVVFLHATPPDKAA